MLDQVLHAAWAYIALAPAAFYGRRRFWPWVLAALLIALPRELVDQWPIERPLDTLLDLSFFCVGGAMAGAFARTCRWLDRGRR